ncbi:MAG: twin-arginine translocase TatA/TatE family subunit, partial [Solirubrobacteraceae bacterium]
MVGDILQPTHLLFVLVVALLVLGPKRLPEVARTLGNGLRDFRSALSGDSHHDEDEPPRNFLAPEESTTEAGTPVAPVPAHQPEAAPAPAHTPEAASVVAEPEPVKPAATEPEPVKPAATEPGSPKP